MSDWVPDFFEYRNGKLTLEKVDLSSLIARFGSPTYVYSRASILAAFKGFQQELTGLDAQICYAVKACSNLSILRLLGDMGAGFDIVSGGELHRAITSGASPRKIVFSGVGKTEQEIDAALSVQGTGIRAFNAESLEELESLSARAQALGKIARVLIRFNPDVNARTHPHIATGLRENKFGLLRKDVLTAFKRWKEGALPGVALDGLSLHIGSQIVSLAPFKDAFEKTCDLISLIEKQNQITLSVMNVGGGLGVPYKKGERSADLKAFAQLIKKYFSTKKIILEPGRSLVANAGVLLTQVVRLKQAQKRHFTILDAGMNDLIRPALYDSTHAMVPLFHRGGKLRSTDVVGPVCESADRFAEKYKLPVSIKPGDGLAILSAGAYGFTMSSQYNSRPRAAELLVDGSKVHVIRERETVEDLVRGELL